MEVIFAGVGSAFLCDTIIGPEPGSSPCESPEFTRTLAGRWHVRDVLAVYSDEWVGSSLWLTRSAASVQPAGDSTRCICASNPREPLSTCTM